MSFIRRHPVIVISLAVSIVAITGATVWATKYDHHASTKMLSGTVIAGVPVGGMRYQEALDAVRTRVETPLHRPIHVQSEQFETTTSAWDLGLQVDVVKPVRKAMDRAHEGNLVQRVWRRMFGNTASTVRVVPKWGPGQLSTLLEQAGSKINLAPVDAKVDSSTGWVNVAPAKEGRALETDKSRALLVEAAKQGTPSVNLAVNTLSPKVDSSAVSKVILVRTGENMLYLYENGKIAKQWPVATGQSAYPTPTGTYRVVEKIVNPRWVNPHSSWSGSMPAVIGPGPGNPLGTRALALSASGILIHATPDDSSIGFSASHGCIRMHAADEMDLFGRVNSGTIVAIVNAGPSRPRGSAPAPAAPDKAAAAQY